MIRGGLAALLAAGLAAWHPGRLTVTPTGSPAHFGFALAASSDGSTLVAGAPEVSVGAHAGQGAAYVFRRRGQANGRSVELLAPDGAAQDRFGIAVAASGDGSVVVVGAQNATVSGHHSAGAVYVFARPPGGWPGVGAVDRPVAKLTVADARSGDQLGASVAVAGDGRTVVAGADGASVGANPQQGAVYVFSGWRAHRHPAAELTAADGLQSDYLGWSVAISPNSGTIVAGAPFAGGPQVGGQGAAYVFVRSGVGWSSQTEAARLTASNGVPGDALGVSVAISNTGATIAAGACCATVVGHYGQGAVYVFTRAGPGWASQVQAGELTAADGRPGDSLGSSVAVSAAGASVTSGAIGARVAGRAREGAVYVFRRPAAGWGDLTQAVKLTAPGGQPHDLIGTSVAPLGSTGVIATGAYGATVAGVAGQGAVYLLRLRQQLR